MEKLINNFKDLQIANTKIYKITDEDFNKIVKKYFSNYFDISPVIDYSYIEKNLSKNEINDLLNYLNNISPYKIIVEKMEKYLDNNPSFRNCFIVPNDIYSLVDIYINNLNLIKN